MQPNSTSESDISNGAGVTKPDVYQPSGGSAPLKKIYSLDSVEVRDPGETLDGPQQHYEDYSYVNKKRLLAISPKRAMLVSSVIIAGVLILVGSIFLFLGKNEKTDEQTRNRIPSQQIDLKNFSPETTPPELTGAQESLLVNGDIVTKSAIKVSNDGFITILQPQTLTSNQAYSLPNASGVICINTNNCNYGDKGQLAQAQADIASLRNNLGQIKIPTVPASSLVNNQAGAVSIQGTSNQISVTNGNGVIRLAAPQDLAPLSSPSFASLVLSGNFSLGGNLILPLNCSALTNGGALTTNGSGQVICSNDDTGSGGGAAVDTPGGTVGTIPVFTAAQTIANSIISQALGTATVSGNLSVTGTISGASLTLAAPLTVPNGGTGATSFTANGLLIGNGGAAISSIAAPSNGQVLLGNGTTPAFASLSGDVLISGGGVTTIQANSVALGVDTTGNYVANVTAGNGIGVSGAAGEGSSHTLSVLYGSAANTAVQGNTSLTVTAGTNLTGGGIITLGAGGSLSVSTVNNPSFTTSVTTPLLILTGAGSNGTLQIANLGQPTTFTIPDPGAASATFCLSSGNCVGGAGGAPNNAGYLTIGNDATLSGERAIAAGTNLSAVDGGANGAYTLNVASAPTFSGLISANGGLSVQTGQNLTINGEAFTDLTGTGLTIGAGALQATLGTSVDLTSEVINSLLIGNGGTGQTSYTDGQLLIGNSVGNTLTKATLTAGAGVNILNGNGTITISSPGSGTCAACANTALSNLSGVAINTSLLSGSATIDLGSTANPFRDLYVGGTATNNFRITGVSAAARVYTLPDVGSDANFCLSTGNCVGGGGGAPNSAAYLTVGNDGTLSGERAITAGTNLSAVDGGANGAYTINTVNNPTFTTSVTTPSLQSSGALNITPGGALTIGATGQTSLLQGSTATIASNGAGNDIILTTADQITLTGFNCTAFGNGGKLTTDAFGNISCASDNGGPGGSVTTSGGNANRMALFTGAQTIADSWLLQNTSTLELDSTRNLSLLGGNLDVTGTGTFSGLVTANGGLSVQTGGTFTFNGDAFTDLTGTGLTIIGNALQSTLGTSVDLTTEVNNTLPIGNGGTNATTAQGAINNLAGLTTEGDILFRNATNTTRLARGANGECLTSSTTSILWGSCQPGGSGVTSIGAIDSQAKSANGAVITGTTLYLQTADLSDPGLVSTGTQSFAGAKTFASATTLQGDITLGDAAADLLTISATIQGANPLVFEGATADGFETTLAIADPTSAVTYRFATAGTGTYDICTTTGNCVGAGGGTAPNNGEYITYTANATLSAERVLTGGSNVAAIDLGTAGQAIINVAAAPTFSGLITANGDLTVQTGDTFTFNGDAFTDLTGNGLQVSTNVLTLALQANKGLEVDANGLSLIDCGDNQILKYSTGTGQWTCQADAGGAGVGDDITVNGSTADNANFLNTAASGTSASTAWTLTSASNPDDITIAIGNASATEAGTVTTGAQTFAGAKTFNSQITASAGISLAAQTLQGTTAVIDFTNFDVSTAGDVTLAGNLTVTNLTGTGNRSVCADAADILVSCGANGNGVTLQQAYDASTNPEIVVNATNGALTVRDASTPLGANLLEVQSNNGATSYLAVNAVGASVTGTFQVSSTIAFGTLGAATTPVALCRNASNQISSCGVNSAGVTLQQAYDADADGTDAVILLNNTDGNLIIRNNGLVGSGRAVLVVDQPLSGSVEGLRVESAGSSNLLTIRDTTATAQDVLSIADGGAITFRNQTNSTAAFRVQNAAGATVFNVDSTNMRVGVHVTFAAMSTPTGLAVGAATSGGSLTASATYRYKVTAIDSTGGETAASTEASGTTTATDLTLPVTWTTVTGASGYKVYRTAANGAADSEVYLTTVLTNSFTDNGSITPGAAVPPTAGTAYVSTSMSNVPNPGLIVGGRGTPAGQLYVSGNLNGITGSVATGTSPASLYVQGRYAYVVNENSNTLAIYDVNNPLAPSLVGSVSTGASTNPSYVYVQGRYAYVINYTSQTMAIYDVSNVFAPTLIGTARTGATPGFVYVQGRYAYVTNFDSSTMTIYDVSNPASPVQTGSIATGTNPGSLQVQGRYAYVTNYTSGTMTIYDVSNPYAPSLVSSTATGAGTTNIAVQGRYAYVTNLIPDTLTIYDVSNPASPTLTSTFATVSDPSTIYLQGRYAYVTSYVGAVFQIVDISNPTQPRQAGLNGTNTTPVAVVAQGRYAYVINKGSNNMITYDLGGAYIQQLEAGGIEAGTLSVNGTANIGGNTSIQGGLSTGDSAQIGGNLGVSGSTFLQGSLSVAGGIQGGVTVYGLSTPGTPTVTTVGTTGTQTWGYSIVAVSASGGLTPVSTQGTTTSGNGVSTLTTSNYQQVSWTPVAGAVSYKVYRTTVAATAPNPSTTGLIGTTSAASFNDTGLIGDGTTASTNDTSGVLGGKNGSGLNNAGLALTIAGGQGTGSAAGGNILFQYAPAGGAGSSLNALQTACSISGTNGSFSCPGAGATSERFGAGSLAAGANTVALGNGASASGSGGIAIGKNAFAGNNGLSNIVIGNGATGDNSSVIIGNVASGGAQNNVIIGITATTNGANNTAIGSGAVGGDDSNVAIGTNASTSGRTGSIAIGVGATATADNQLVIGSGAVGSSISSVVIGNGVTNANPQGFTLIGTTSSAIGVDGAYVNIIGGLGSSSSTGSAGGSVNLQGGTAGGSGANTGGGLNLWGGDGSATGAGGDVFLQSGAGGATSGASGALSLQSGNTTNGNSGTITLQSGNAATGTAGNIAIDVGTSSTGTPAISIGNSTNSPAKTITIGGSTQTGTITLGQSTASNIINIGNATIANANTGTINIGTSATGATGKTVIVIGSTNDASSLTLQSGTGNINLSPSGVSNTGVVVKPGTDSTKAFQIQDSAGTSNLFVADTTNTRIGIGVVPVTTAGSGLLQVGSGGTTPAANGISFGGDANLYRSAAHVLKTDDSLNVAATSTTALLIQNATATTLLSADTSGMELKVGGTTTTFATLTIDNAHFKSTQTNAPTIAMTTCVGAEAVPAGATDSAGSFTTGNLTTGGTCALTLTFNKAYGAAPKSVVISPSSSTAPAKNAYVSSTTTTTFVVTFQAAAGTSETDSYYYWVVE